MLKVTAASRISTTLSIGLILDKLYGIPLGISDLVTRTIVKGRRPWHRTSLT